MKRILILGGMGPQASIELHKRIIDRACENGAQNGNDFPHIIHFSLPIDDFISDQSKIDKAFRHITQSLAQVKPTKNDSIVIACNTAHLLRAEIERSTGAAVVSLIDSTLAHILSNGIKKVHLIGSPTTLRTRLYEKPLRDRGVNVIKSSRNEQDEVETIIRDVIRGVPVNVAREDFAQRAPLLLGCTELSCAMGSQRNVIDPLAIIVNVLLPPNVSETTV